MSLRLIMKALKLFFKGEKSREVCFNGKREEKSCPLIPIMKASRPLCQERIEYWWYAIDTQEKKEKTEGVPAICEFRYVFSKELAGLPPSRRNWFWDWINS